MTTPRIFMHKSYNDWKTGEYPYGTTDVLIYPGSLMHDKLIIEVLGGNNTNSLVRRRMLDDSKTFLKSHQFNVLEFIDDGLDLHARIDSNEFSEAMLRYVLLTSS